MRLPTGLSLHRPHPVSSVCGGEPCESRAAAVRNPGPATRWSTLASQLEAF